METLLVLLVLAGLAGLAAPYLRRESPVVRGLVIGFGIVVFVRYMLWRIVSLPRWELTWPSIGSYVFLAMELTAGYLWVLNALSLRRTVDRTPEVERQLDWYGDQAPRIDIFIATYNESWEVLEKTVVGATSQEYPNYRAWILDDGNRPWLRERAEALGLGYITRSSNVHYKAGNLNHGIAHLRANGIEPAYVAVLDADFIARPQFLRRTLALMKTPEVGIVQTPQCFYNPDPHQQAFGGIKNWPDEQRAWFDVYLPALDALGCATCCGTSCLIRVTALDAIGGFPTESVCEDTLSSIKMSSKGYRTVFLKEPLTVGLAPEGIGEFLTQRARWLLGGVQNTRWAGSGSGSLARIDYWLRLWRNAIWGIMPAAWVTSGVIYWFTGVALIPARDFWEAASYFAPLFLDRFFQGWLFRGRQLFFVSDAVWALLSPLWIKQTFLAITGKKSSFKVTDKAVHRDRTVVHWGLLPFYATLIVLLLAGLVYNLVDSRAPAYRDGLLQVNTVMTVYFVLMLLAGMAPLIEPPKRRTAERYGSSETVHVTLGGKQLAWRCKDISLGGLLVDTLGHHEIPEVVDLRLNGIGVIRAALVRQPSRTLAAFEFRSPEQRPALIRKLFFSEEYIVPPAQWSLARCVGAFFRKLVY